MKKLLFVILLITIVIYSCDEEVQTSPLTINMASKGTLKGYVYAESRSYKERTGTSSG